ncbi:MFS transporter [Sulfurisphaera ohwakuensis]|uniref:MFS family permease n=1 Tax=Sulfurisphaera ohwakuensis TaxID=69656 RepID=A0A650CHU9_SULOH|nr:MFS transporter [Sulfurisphaera ohwakuensis]MBB5254701.1 MFS family permease [Sulfurisphaera ohwakuensis]QGR17346.1 MFS transporter [Sulfurisphaera ohwakuensis]
MNKHFLLFTILVFFTGLYLGTLRIDIPEFEKQLHIPLELSVLLPLIFFGFIKGSCNYIAGRLSDKLGRKKLLIIGWIVAIFSIPLLFLLNIYTIIIISILLAINQALTWTTTVTSQIDISGKLRAGLATGINEMSGYLGVSIGSLLASYIFKISFVILLITSILAVILSYTVMETKTLIRENNENIKIKWIPITRISIAGLLEKFVDSSFFILIPTYLLLQHYSLTLVGLIVSSYAFVWSLSQPLFGYLADLYSRKFILILGFILMFLGFIHYSSYPMLFSVIEGIGMGMIYPNLIAAVNDIINEKVRGKALGYYRLYRDSGYGIAGIVIPLLYILLGFNKTLLVIGILQLLSLILIL